MEIVPVTPAFIDEGIANEIDTKGELVWVNPLTADELGILEEGETIPLTDPRSIMKILYFQDGSGTVIDNRTEASDEFGIVTEDETIPLSHPDSVMALLYFKDGSGLVVDNRTVESLEATTDYTVPIESVSVPWSTHYFGPFYTNIGQQGSVNLAWIPTTCNMEVGVYNKYHYYGEVCSGGACSVQGKLKTTPENYFVYVKNLCAQFVNYSGFLSD